MDLVDNYKSFFLLHLIYFEIFQINLPKISPREKILMN